MSHFEADVLKVHMQNDKSELSIIQLPIDGHFLLFECKICPLSQQNSDLSALKSPWCREILSELGIFRITVSELSAQICMENAIFRTGTGNSFRNTNFRNNRVRIHRARLY